MGQNRSLACCGVQCMSSGTQFPAWTEREKLAIILAACILLDQHQHYSIRTRVMRGVPSHSGGRGVPF